MAKKKISINSEHLLLACEAARALAHPLRLKILEYIDQWEGGINVNKIFNTLKLEQSITSQHLKILRLAGILIVSREEKFIRYSVNQARVRRISESISTFLAADETDYGNDDDF